MFSTALSVLPQRTRPAVTGLIEGSYIASRFTGPALLITPDRFEAVLPPFTDFEERLQRALLVKTTPQPIAPPSRLARFARFFGIGG